MLETLDEAVTTETRSESAALARVAEQLTLDLDDIPAEEIEVALRAEQERFVNSPVRDFIPILVERSVRRRFAQQLMDPAGRSG
jgi:hypothetical protein